MGRIDERGVPEPGRAMTIPRVVRSLALAWALGYLGWMAVPLGAPWRDSLAWGVLAVVGSTVFFLVGVPIALGSCWAELRSRDEHVSWVLAPRTRESLCHAMIRTRVWSWVPVLGLPCLGAGLRIETGDLGVFLFLLFAWLCAGTFIGYFIIQACLWCSVRFRGMAPCVVAASLLSWGSVAAIICAILLVREVQQRIGSPLYALLVVIVAGACYLGGRRLRFQAIDRLDAALCDPE